MKTISVSNDIIPVGKFKTRISQWLKNIQSTGQPLIITLNGKPAGVLLAPKEYDELVYRKEFLDSIYRGLSDAVAGRTYTTKEVLSKLEQDKIAD